MWYWDSLPVSWQLSVVFQEALYLSETPKTLITWPYNSGFFVCTEHQIRLSALWCNGQCINFFYKNKPSLYQVRRGWCRAACKAEGRLSISGTEEWQKASERAGWCMEMDIWWCTSVSFTVKKCKVVFSFLIYIIKVSFVRDYYNIYWLGSELGKFDLVLIVSAS